jgi:hypothetical protein
MPPSISHNSTRRRHGDPLGGERRDAFGVEPNLSGDLRASEHSQRAQIPKPPVAQSKIGLVDEIYAGRGG